MKKTHQNPLSLYLLCLLAQGFRTWTNVWLVSSFIALFSWLVVFQQPAPLFLLSYDFISGAALPAIPVIQGVLALLVWVACGIVFAWLDTLRFGGINTIRHLPRTLLLQGSGKRTLVILLFLPIAFYSFVTEHRLWSALHPYAPNIALILFVGAFFYLFRPPSALILTTSSEGAKLLLNVASTTLFPLRTVALLDTKRVTLPAHMLGEDNLRTFNFSNWQSAVRVLMDTAPLIVIDGRTPSEVVAEEMGWIASSPSRLSKTIIITDDIGHIHLWGGSLPTESIFAVKRCPLLALPATIWKSQSVRAASSKVVPANKIDIRK